MQEHDWNDLKYVLALYRVGTLAGAGRILCVSETTVARRVRSVEQNLRTPLFLRNKSGTYKPTDVGSAVILLAEKMERSGDQISQTVGKFSNRLYGTVRITAVPMIINRILVPNVAEFRTANPDLTLELIPEQRNLSLSQREADLALRFARPETGGIQIKARKIGDLAFAVYRSALGTSGAPHNPQWIGYDDAHSHLPQARWMQARPEVSKTDFPCLRVSDAETAIEAVVAGLGWSVLPVIIANRDHRLQRVEYDTSTKLPVREVWMLSHVDQAGQNAIQAAKDWLTNIGWHSPR